MVDFPVRMTGPEPADSSRNHALWRLHIVPETRSGVRILFVKGRIGAAGAPVFGRAFMEELAAGHRRLLVDLEGVDYISSAGLRVIEESASRARERAARLVLCGLSEQVRIAFDLAGASEHLTIESSWDCGVAALSADRSAP